MVQTDLPLQFKYQDFFKILNFNFENALKDRFSKYTVKKQQPTMESLLPAELVEDIHRIIAYNLSNF